MRAGLSCPGFMPHFSAPNVSSSPFAPAQLFECPCGGVDWGTAQD